MYVVVQGEAKLESKSRLVYTLCMYPSPPNNHHMLKVGASIHSQVLM